MESGDFFFLRGKKNMFKCCMGFSRESKMDNEGEEGENYYRFSLSMQEGVGSITQVQRLFLIQ